MFGLSFLPGFFGGEASSKQTFKSVAVATWRFGGIAVRSARDELLSGESALTSVEKGINAVELDTEDQYYVGKGGLPNAEGVMEFDAAIMDHDSRYSAVLCLQDIATPVSVARCILDHSPHNVLSGQGALQFALSHGFKLDKSVLTEEAKKEWMEWKKTQGKELQDKGHDTVGLICLDKEGRLACGTSTSGWKFKHPGRVGDSPLPGGGLYCDGAVGAAVCTGDGEEIQRSCLAFLVVELMRGGLSPQEACAEGVRRLSRLRPKHGTPSTCTVAEDAEDAKDAAKLDSTSAGSGMYSALTVGVIAVDAKGNVGAASSLCEKNPHRGNPFFEAMVWREGDVGSDGEDLSVLQASFAGAAF